MVWQVTRCVKVPVVGVGGILTADDALEFLITGATAVQIGTANFVNPRATEDIIDGLARWLADHGEARLTDIIGTLEPISSA
jgi:dihydroorotate dehydrogenase (NAD+) catalytic subunit